MIELKKAYWDPKRKDTLMALLESYAQENFPRQNLAFLEKNLQKEYICDQIRFKNNKIELLLVFDKVFIGFVQYLMARKNPNNEYLP